MTPDDTRPLAREDAKTEKKTIAPGSHIPIGAGVKTQFTSDANPSKLRKQRKKLSERQVQQIADGMSHAAMATLAEIMGDPKQKANCRLRAAETILAYAAGKPVSMLHLSTDPAPGDGTPAAPVKTKEELDREAFQKVLEQAADKAGTALTFTPVAPIVTAPVDAGAVGQVSDKARLATAVIAAAIDVAGLKPD